MLFKFLHVFVHSGQFTPWKMICLLIWGHQMYWAKYFIPYWPGCVSWRIYITAFLRVKGITNLPSMYRNPPDSCKFPVKCLKHGDFALIVSTLFWSAFTIGLNIGSPSVRRATSLTLDLNLWDVQATSSFLGIYLKSTHGPITEESLRIFEYRKWRN